MFERHSSIHSKTKNDDDSLVIPNEQIESSLRNVINEAFERMGSTNEKPFETNRLIDETRTEIPVTSNFQCSNISSRYIIAIWAFFGFFCMYAMRVNLSVAIVAMVAPQSSLNQSIKACEPIDTNSTKPSQKYEFDWSPKVQGIVLGAFFYGYITMQVIGGNLAEKFGAKWIYGGCIFIAGILTLLAPLAARIHVGLFIAIRFLTGIIAGPGTPSATALWGRWIPISERSTVPPIAQTGSNFGIIITTPLMSIMIEKYFLGGWPSAFYVFGVLSCLWFIGWYRFVYNSPDQHPRISDEERLFLKKSIPENIHKHQKTPWKHIIRCPPVYGIAIMHVCNNYIFYTLLTSLPIYFATILNFNLRENGFIFALPYFAQFLITVVSGAIVDRIRIRNIISITRLRKLQTIIGTLGTCSFLVAIGYMKCNHIGAVICCIFSVGFLGLYSCGALVSHLDVASNYAGTLIGITNSLGTIPGFVGPYVVGAITNNNQTIEAWRLIFNISAGIGVFGCIAYCILFNGEEQPWNRISQACKQHESTTSIET